MSQLTFDFELNPWVNLIARRVGKFGVIRKALGTVISEIQKQPDLARAPSVVKNLIKLVNEAHTASKNDWEAIRKNMDKYSRGELTQAYTGNLECAIPNNGFGIDEIRRLLLAFGTLKYWKTIPTAFRFTKHQQPDA